ncbi:KGK domain-containing protein [Anabaena cylindrica UHCC 0172]|uniref:KGK domain-containing protein n=1 Tax=Anabaena cylindrica TaxID=1165 RepID=UPI002B21B610|nr:KGK domain-containing protein [Anabaena cylindrica]MEA5552739.1 KGK domain-containing protein [Anabaena cylindrica UHCC 0172]
MENGWEPVDNEDTVLSITKVVQRYIMDDPMFKVAQILSKIKSNIISIDSSYWEKTDEYIEKKRWLNEGVDCEIMKPGGYWKKGKLRVRVTLEFCPDEPESPLDDLRNKLKEVES